MLWQLHVKFNGWDKDENGEIKEEYDKGITPDQCPFL